MELDLNGSTLQVLPNSEPVYNLLHIYDVENVKIKTGWKTFMNIIHCYKYSIFIVFKIIIVKVKLGEVFSYIK